MSKTVISYADALLETMDGALRDNPNAFIMGQGVADFKGTFGSTTDLFKKYGPEQVIDTPIAEEGMTGVTVGAALNGMYPISTHIRGDFVLLTCNQIINIIAKYKYMFGGLYELPMLIRTVIGRSWGQGAQHSQSLQSLFAHIPGLLVLMPSSAQEILTLYPYVIKNYPGPVISFEHRVLYDIDFEVDRAAVELENPLSSRKVREGKDVTIVATSIMVLEAQRAANHLQKVAGIECDIIDLNCLTHPDVDMLMESVGKTGRLIVTDTSWLPYGTAAEVCRLVCERNPAALQKPVVTLGMANAPCPTAKVLEDIYYPTIADIVDSAVKLVTGNPNHGVELPDEKSVRDVVKHFRGPF